MPQISLTVEVPWPKGKLTFSKLERAVHRAAWERACRLAASHPSRTAARLLPDLIGSPTDHRVLWRLVQEAGRVRRAELERARAAMFDLGEAPPEPERPPEMVVSEIDGAVLRPQGGGSFEAKVAAAYTGKQGRRHRRGGPASHLLEPLPLRPDPPGPTPPRSMTHLVAKGTLDPKTARETRAFLQLNAPAIWAFRGLLEAGAPPELCTRGSGVIEHTIDLVVARRMKRQGMFWSRDGAHNVLVLRALLVAPAAGRAWWQEVIG